MPSRTGPWAFAFVALAFCLSLPAAACNALTGVDSFQIEEDAALQDVTTDRQGPRETSVGQPDSAPESGWADADATVLSVESGAQLDASAEGEGASFTDNGGSDATIDSASDADDASVEAGSESGFDAAADTADEAPADAGGEASACAVTYPVCSGGCPVAHFNGIGQTFYDCVEAGTYNETQAFEACSAFTGDAGACVNNPITCSQNSDVCSSLFPICACWRYSGTNNVGKALDTDASTCACVGGNGVDWY